MKILIVGAGSIGKRHAQNFHSLGCEIGAVDPQETRRQEMSYLLPALTFDSLESALKQQWDAAVIATAPALHIQQRNQIPCPVLMEKNLCLPGEDNSNLLVGERDLMGYSWRWWPNISHAKLLMDQVGEVSHVSFTMAAHLADWHPWEAIEHFYAAERGGVLNEAHWHDVMLWFFGMPNSVFSSHRKISNLPIRTPDILDSIFFYDDFNVSFHYDLIARPHNRSMQIVGERGTLAWFPDRIRLGYFKGEEWATYPNKNERNDMFRAEAAHFLRVIVGQEKPLCTIEDGKNVMRLLDASVKSSGTSRVVELS